MNWFERYGIVGLYFVLVTFVWSWVFFPANSLVDKLVATGNEWDKAAAAMALPAGYLISILSQLIYYCVPGPWRIHQKVWQAKPPARAGAGVPCEPTAEVDLTLPIRSKSDKGWTAAGRWINTFTRRRWDVIAINNSIIVATILSPAVALIVHQAVTSLRWWALAVLVLVPIVCVLSSGVMLWQNWMVARYVWLHYRKGEGRQGGSTPPA